MENPNVAHKCIEFYLEYLTSLGLSEEEMDDCRDIIIDGKLLCQVNMDSIIGDVLGVSFYKWEDGYMRIYFYCEKGNYLLNKYRDKYSKTPVIITAIFPSEIEKYTKAGYLQYAKWSNEKVKSFVLKPKPASDKMWEHGW